MDRLVDAGKVRFIGVSNFSLEQLNEAQAASRHKIVANQVQYSLFARSIEEELLPYCQQNAVTIIAYSPLAAHGGLDYLTGRKSHEALEAVSRATGKTPAQVALNWCTSKEGVMAIPKSNSVQRTEENCAASGWRLSEGHMTLLEKPSSRGPFHTAHVVVSADPLANHSQHILARRILAAFSSLYPCSINAPVNSRHWGTFWKCDEIPTWSIPAMLTAWSMLSRSSLVPHE